MQKVNFKIGISILFMVFLATAVYSNSPDTFGLHNDLLYYFPSEFWGATQCFSSNNWDNGLNYGWIYAQNELPCTIDAENKSARLRGYDSFMIGINASNYVTGINEYALRINNEVTDEYLNLTDNNIFTNIKNFTVMLWVNASPNNNIAVIYEKGCSQITEATMGLYLEANNSINFTFMNTTGQNITHRSSVNISNNQFYHIAITHNGSKLLMYINGTLDSTNNGLGGNLNNSNKNVIVGNSLGTACAGIDGSFAFNGTLDDMRLYPKVLTSYQISDYYNSSDRYRKYTEDIGARYEFEELNFPTGIKVNKTIPAPTTVGGTTTFSTTLSIKQYGYIKQLHVDSSLGAIGVTANITRGGTQLAVGNCTTDTTSNTIDFTPADYTGILNAGDTIIIYFNASGNFLTRNTSHTFESTFINYTAQTVPSWHVDGSGQWDNWLVYETSSDLYVYDSSAYKYNAGKFRDGYQLSHKHYLEVEERDNQDVGQALTMGAFIKTDDTDACTILVHDNSSFKYMFGIDDDTNAVANITQASGSTGVKGSTALNDNTYHSIIATFDKNLLSNRLKLYVDGSLVAQADAYNENITLGDEGLFIGQGGNMLCNATIDEVFVYKRALNQEEITYLQSYPLFNTSTLNITFRDSTTGAIVTSNLYLQSITNINSDNYTITGGNISITGFHIGAYTFRYGDSSYPQNYYIHNILNRGKESLTFYLVNSSETTNVTAIVYDEVNNLVANAIIQYLKYDIVTNSYLLIGMTQTSFDGLTVMPLELNTEYYKFYIFYEGDLKLATEPTYIYQDTLTFQIILGEETASKFYESEGIFVNVSFNNNTNNFRMDYADTQQIGSRYCLEVYKLNALDSSDLYNSSCITTYSGSILVGVAPTNGTTYVAEAYYSASDKYYIGGASHTYFNANPLGFLGLFAVLILTLTMVFLSRNSLSTMIILTPLPIVIASWTNIIPISKPLASGLMIGAFLVSWVVKKID